MRLRLFVFFSLVFVLTFSIQSAFDSRKYSPEVLGQTTSDLLEILMTLEEIESAEVGTEFDAVKAKRQQACEIVANPLEFSGFAKIESISRSDCSEDFLFLIRAVAAQIMQSSGQYNESVPESITREGHFIYKALSMSFDQLKKVLKAEVESRSRAAGLSAQEVPQPRFSSQEGESSAASRVLPLVLPAALLVGAAAIPTMVGSDDAGMAMPQAQNSSIVTPGQESSIGPMRVGGGDRGSGPKDDGKELSESEELLDCPPTLWIRDLKTPGNYAALAIFVGSTGSLLYDALFPVPPSPKVRALWRVADQRRQKELSSGTAQNAEPMLLDAGSTKPEDTRNVAVRAGTYLLQHKRAIASIASGGYLAGNVVRALMPVFFPSKK